MPSFFSCLHKSICLLPFLLLFYCPVKAADIPQKERQILQERKEIYFRFIPPKEVSADTFVRLFSVDYFDEASGYVYAYAGERTFREFYAMEVDYELLTPPGLLTQKSNLNMLSEVDVAQLEAWDFYPTYEAYESMMAQFQENFPELFEKVEIVTLASGRRILFGRITANVEEPHSRPRFMYTSTMHGDETAGFNLSLRLIHFLLNNYDTDPRITHLLDNLEIWICPNENPDGSYRHDNSTLSGATRSNLSGVDLNRNYPNPIHVPVPDHQQETQAMMELVETKDFVMSANMHGGIECVNYPWDSWRSNERTHADHDWWQLVMHEYADTARYYSPFSYMNPSGPSFNNGVTHGGDWYVVYGSRQDYMNWYAHQREFTLELSNTKLLPASMLPDHWEYNYRSLLNYMEQSLYGIHGQVTDMATGEPLRAKIELSNHDKDQSWVYSSADHGGFSRPVLAGNYTLVAKAEGYPSLTFENVLVENYATTWLDIELGAYTATEFLDAEVGIQLYPNPVKQTLTITGLSGTTQIRIWDMQGRLLMEHLTEASEEIDVSDLPAGMYLVRFTHDAAVVNKKFLKK